VISNSDTRGLVVTPISIEDAGNIYHVRAALESLIAGQFIERANTPDFAVFRRAAEDLREAYKTQQLEKILDAKKTYYVAFCAGAKNQIVFELLMVMHLRTSQLRAASISRPERNAQSIAEIDALLSAIERRDTVAAQAAARTHVDNTAASAFFAIARKDAVEGISEAIPHAVETS
jgi:DNA-binding GntR family transcriptional regulator